MILVKFQWVLHLRGGVLFKTLLYINGYMEQRAVKSELLDAKTDSPKKELPLKGRWQRFKDKLAKGIVILSIAVAASQRPGDGFFQGFR